MIMQKLNLTPKRLTLAGFILLCFSLLLPSLIHSARLAQANGVWCSVSGGWGDRVVQYGRDCPVP
jgi:hypothetical protein